MKAAILIFLFLFCVSVIALWVCALLFAFDIIDIGFKWMLRIALVALASYGVLYTCYIIDED